MQGATKLKMLNLNLNIYQAKLLIWNLNYMTVAKTDKIYKNMNKIKQSFLISKKKNFFNTTYFFLDIYLCLF